MVREPLSWRSLHVNPWRVVGLVVLTPIAALLVALLSWWAWLVYHEVRDNLSGALRGLGKWVVLMVVVFGGGWWWLNRMQQYDERRGYDAEFP